MQRFSRFGRLCGVQRAVSIPLGRSCAVAPLQATATRLGDVTGRLTSPPSAASRATPGMRGFANQVPRVRGMQDWLPATSRRMRHITETFLWIADRYHFAEINTPILEHSDVFERSLGEASDVVSKEMFTVPDRSGHTLVMRPENTASVVRAVVASELGSHMPQRLCYQGPMFRYERPQRGRFRQFHQIGVELLGIDSPMADVETIEMGYRVLLSIGLGTRAKLHINSLGTRECQDRYTEVLREYLEGFRSELSEDSVARLDRGAVLRILDSKAECDQAIVAGAPSLTASLSTDAAERFAAVLNGLDSLQIPYVVDTSLVRGLDYYRHTAFEFLVDDEDTSGPIGTVLGGGRYDGLVEALGGPAIPGVGWAAGLERLSELCLAQPPAPAATLAVVPVKGKGASTHQMLHVERQALRVSQHLRDMGVPVRHMYAARPIKKQLKRANRAGAEVCILVGDDELENAGASIKVMSTGNQTLVPLPLLVDAVRVVLDRLEAQATAEAEAAEQAVDDAFENDMDSLESVLESEAEVEAVEASMDPEVLHATADRADLDDP